MIKNILPIFILMFTINGCMSKHTPITNSYEINTKLLNKQCKKTQKINLSNIMIPSKISGKKIAYKESDNKLDYFSKNFWATNLEDMVNTTIIKTAHNNCIEISNTSDKNLEIEILDLYFNAKDNTAIFNAIGKINDRQIITQQSIQTNDGEFEEIIKSLNQAIISGLDDIFGQI